MNFKRNIELIRTSTSSCLYLWKCRQILVKMLIFVSIMQECSHCSQRSVTAKVNLIGWSEPSVGKYLLKKLKSVKPQFKIGVLFEVTACTTNKACFT